AALFKDIDIEPFLKALQDVLSVFDQSTESGKALHDLFTMIFTDLFGRAAQGGPLVKSLLKEMIIGWLQAYIAIRPVARAIAVVIDALRGLGSAQGGASAIMGLLRAIGVALMFLVDPVDAVNLLFYQLVSSVANAGAGITGSLNNMIASAEGFPGKLLDLGSN